MRKLAMTFFIFSLMPGELSMTAYAADCGQETMIDQAGDWFGAFGKKGMEKNKILARRKADRMLACAKQKAQKAAKEVQRSSADMRKRLGL